MYFLFKEMDLILISRVFHFLDVTDKDSYILPESCFNCMTSFRNVMELFASNIEFRSFKYFAFVFA